MLRTAVFLLLLSAVFLSAMRADAGLLGRLADTVGDAGGAARKADGIGGADLPGAALRAAKDPNTTPLALGVDADGTVRLTDALGHSVHLPAGGELDAVLKASAKGAKQVAVVADARTLAEAGDVANALAKRGALKLWYGKKAMQVRVTDRGLAVEVRENVLTPLPVSRAGQTGAVRASLISLSGLREVDYALNKTLNRGTVLVVEFGKTATGPRRVGFGDGPSGKPGETVTVTRDDLLNGFSGNRGGTVILSGLIQGGAIRARGGAVPLDEIRAAAASADVHLVLLDGPAKAAHKALEQASTYGDLLTALAPKRSAIVADARRLRGNRVRLSIRPEMPVSPPNAVAPTVADDLSQVATAGIELGVRSVVHGIELDTRDRSTEQDLSMRLIPFVPYWAHVLYALNLIVGIYGSGHAWRFWRRIWPMQARARRVVLAHVPRFLMFLFVFLPLTGFIWAVIAFFAGIGNTIMSILRLSGLVPRKAA